MFNDFCEPIVREKVGCAPHTLNLWWTRPWYLGKGVIVIDFAFQRKRTNVAKWLKYARFFWWQFWFMPPPPLFKFLVTPRHLIDFTHHISYSPIWFIKLIVGRLAQYLKTSLSVREVRGSIPCRSNRTQCQQLATTTTFLRRSFAQALNMGDTSYHLLHSSQLWWRFDTFIFF